MKKVVSLGEMLLRLSPSDTNMIMQTSSNSLDMNYGGAELNVSVNLANYGVTSGYITKIPNNVLGKKGIKILKSYGVNTEDILFGGDRIGIYFLEKGYSVRTSVVTYDRKYSSFSEIEMTDEEIIEILKKYDVLFLSGITVSISEKTFELSKRFMKLAKELGKEVIFDCNYRSKLISLEEAGKRYKQIIEYVDVLFAGYLDFINIFEFDFEKYNGENYLEYYKKLYKEVYKKYNFKYIISSIRKSVSANKNIYSGIITNGKETVKGKEFEVEIIDRVGTGDGFTAGAIYSYLKGNNLTGIVNFAIGAGALKHTINGDVSEFTEDMILEMISKESYDVAR